MSKNRLKGMSKKELRNLVRRLETCLATYDSNPAVQKALQKKQKTAGN